MVSTVACRHSRLIRILVNGAPSHLAPIFVAEIGRDGSMAQVGFLPRVLPLILAAWQETEGLQQTCSQECQNFFTHASECLHYDDRKVCGCSMSTSPLAGDARCCLLEAFRKCLTSNCSHYAPFDFTQVTFNTKTDQATDGWWILGQGRLAGTRWKFNSTDLGTCKLFSHKGIKGGNKSYNFAMPEDWSGVFYAAVPNFTQIYGQRGNAIQQTVKMGFTIEESAKSFNWDLSAIPNGAPGECLDKSWVGKSYCDITFNKSATDDNCKSVGGPSNPSNWSCPDPHDAGCHGGCPTDSVKHPYREGWWGMGACYNYDECKERNGGWCSYFNQRGYKVKAAKDLDCHFNKGGNCECPWDSARSLPKNIFQCSFGEDEKDIGGPNQDCFTAPHDDRKDISCDNASPGEQVLSVDICLWGDKDCDGTLKSTTFNAKCEGKVKGKCPTKGTEICNTNGKCCPEDCPDYDPQDLTNIKKCEELLDHVKDEAKVNSTLRQCQGYSLPLGNKRYACMLLSTQKLQCEPTNFTADETVSCTAPGKVQNDPDLHWTRFECEQAPGKAWCEVRPPSPLEKCEALCPKTLSKCENCYNPNNTPCFDSNAGVCAGLKKNRDQKVAEKQDSFHVH